MTQSTHKARPAIAALIAALAASTAPAVAQEVPAPLPPAAAAQTVPAPAPTVPEVTPPLVTAPAPTASPSVAVPVVTRTAPAAEAATPVPQTAEPRAEAPVGRAPTRVEAATPRAERSVAEPAAPVADTPAPAEAVADPVTPPAAAVDVTPAPEPEARPEPVAVAANDWLLPAAGGVAVLIVGLGLLMARRRRKDNAPVMERGVEPVTAAPSTMTPQPVRQPAMVAAPLGEGLGRHVAQAEQGPTPDNPFLTRRNRLRRARFHDRRERLALAAATPTRPAAEPTRPVAAPRPAAVVLPRPSPAQPALRPQFGWPYSKPAFGDA